MSGPRHPPRFIADFGPEAEVKVQQGEGLWVDVRTPDGPVFAGLAERITVPGTKGGFGVLPRHAPLMSSVEVGLTRIKGLDGREYRIVTGDGFCEVFRNVVLLLVDFGDDTADIDVERAREARDRAAARLHERQENVDRARAEAALRRAMMRLRHASQPQI